MPSLKWRKKRATMTYQTLNRTYEPNRMDPAEREEEDDRCEGAKDAQEDNVPDHGAGGTGDEEGADDRSFAEHQDELGSGEIGGVRKSMRIKERREMGLHVSLSKPMRKYGKRAIKAEC